MDLRALASPTSSSSSSSAAGTLSPQCLLPYILLVTKSCSFLLGPHHPHLLSLLLPWVGPLLSLLISEDDVRFRPIPTPQDTPWVLSPFLSASYLQT